MVDKKYCMSSYLMFRTIVDNSKSFSEKSKPVLWKDYGNRTGIHDSIELEEYLRERVLKAIDGKKIAIALSGGIDSAILARFMPKGSVAYTFKCIVPGVDVIDETLGASKYAEYCGLEHRIVEVYWEDFEKYAPILMKKKGSPIHSIEVQIYKAALQAKNDGMDALLFGENADIIYGGMDGLLKKDWLFGEFVDRYSYVMPYKALKESELILEPYLRFEKDGHIDPHSFINEIFRREAMGTYSNATNVAGIEAVCPFSETYMAVPIDYERIRKGESKYLVREVFARLYPGFEMPPKIPMPRPMNEWFKDWQGPIRQEFWPHCTDNMTGDQKWMVWALEKFLSICEAN